ncbi:MAG: o-succinylbenzoate synthase [Actinomycetota bacterium]|nr:o-succinylbenzoate synthase [Actinomycetota bacterium]
MAFDGVEVYWTELSLRSEVRTAAGVHRRRPLLLVRILLGDGVDGWGECGALGEGTSVDPSVARVWRTLGDEVLPGLFDRDPARPTPWPPSLPTSDPEPARRTAAAALEMAVLDATLRTTHASLARHLGVARAWVRSGAVIGIPPDRRVVTLLEAVSHAVLQGALRARLKIEPGWDVAPVRTVREAFPELGIQVDANGAYRMGAAGESAAERLAALDDLGLTCIEQPLDPLDPDDLASHAELARIVQTPICLDESLTTPARVEQAIARDACRVACLKPSRLGGIEAFQAALKLCVAAGIDAFVGGLFESGLGRSVNACLAGLEGITLPSDVSNPSSYLVEDLQAPHGHQDGSEMHTSLGQVAVWQETGVGPLPTPDVLARHTRHVLAFGPHRGPWA